MRTSTRAWIPLAVALSVWAALIAGSHVWARLIVAGGGRVRVGAPPIMGRIDPGLPAQTLLALAVIVAAVAFLPWAARRLSWAQLLAVSGLGAGAWGVSLAMTDGAHAIAEPLTHPADYLRALPLIPPPRELLATFAERIGEFTVHVRGHPPGFILLLWTMDRVGLAGPGWAALPIIAGTVATPPAALVALREIAGEDRARRAAPFLVLAPTAIWMITSANAFYTGVIAWGIALFVLGARRTGHQGDLLAFTAGVVCGLALHLSYGIAPLGIVPLVVAAWCRTLRPLVAGGIGVVAVALVSGAFGFWWHEGLLATIDQYRIGISGQRPAEYFVVANLAAFAIALGPAAAAGLVRLRDPKTWVLVGAVAFAVAAANFSLLSKGEVERIWLHFAPWILLACCSLWDRRGSLRAVRVWLAAQGLWALAVQLTVDTPW